MLDILVLEAMSATGNHFRLHKSLASAMNPNCAMFLALLLDKHSYWNNQAINNNTIFNGWFFKTQEEIEEELTLSKDEQRTVRTFLVKNSLIEEKEERYLGGRRVLFKINFESLQKILNDYHKVKKSPCTTGKSLLIQDEKVHKTSPCIYLKEEIEENVSSLKENRTEKEVVKFVTEMRKIIPKEALAETISTPKELEKPSPISILRSWKAQLPVRPPWENRRSHLEDLFSTLKSYGYKEDDISHSFRDSALSPWSPFKGAKNADHMVAKSNEDYELAMITLSPEIKIIEVKRSNQIKKSPKIGGEIDIDTAIAMTTDDDELAKIFAEYKRLTEDTTNE